MRAGGEEGDGVRVRVPVRSKGRHQQKRPALPVFSLLAPYLKDLETGCVIEESPMNGQETEYARMLEARRMGGEILWWGFQTIKLRIGHAAWYTPDFQVLLALGQIEIHEFKGHWEEAARVRIKAAAGLYPWLRFVAVRKIPRCDGGGYEVERIRAHHTLMPWVTPQGTGDPGARVLGEAMLEDGRAMGPQAEAAGWRDRS